MSVETEQPRIPPSGDGRGIPRPVMKKVRWPIALVWLVPIAAAIGAGIYFYEYFQQRGPVITISFTDGTGIRSNDTKVMYRGVEIGVVEDVTVSADHDHVIVSARLHRPEADMARAGTEFWVVRPQVSMSGISGLSTILSGPYIDLMPGTGEAATEFAGLDQPPQIPEPGLTIRIRAARVEQLQIGAPIFYRGIQIGSVRSMALTNVANGVELTVLIQPRYAVLVRTTSIFWLVKGVDIKGGIFSGVKLNVDSLQALVEGGITFNTSPKNLGQPAPADKEFALYEEPKDEWVNWAPPIALPPEPAPQPQSTMHLPTGADALRSGGSAR